MKGLGQPLKRTPFGIGQQAMTGQIDGLGLIGWRVRGVEIIVPPAVRDAKSDALVRWLPTRAAHALPRLRALAVVEIAVALGGKAG